MIKIISDLFYYLGVVEGRSLSSDSSVLVSQTNSGSSTSGSSSESDTKSSSHFSWKLPEERNSYFAAGLCLLSCSKMTKIKYTNYQLEITITRKCCLKGTDWKLAFGSSVGIIENILACVQPELQASYTCNTYSNV